MGGDLLDFLDEAVEGLVPGVDARLEKGDVVLPLLVKPAGDGAKGYLSGTFHASGKDFKAIQDILKYVYDGNKATDPAFKSRVGEVLYNRGVVGAMWTAEASSPPIR